MFNLFKRKPKEIYLDIPAAVVEKIEKPSTEIQVIIPLDKLEIKQNINGKVRIVTPKELTTEGLIEEFRERPKELTTEGLIEEFRESEESRMKLKINVSSVPKRKRIVDIQALRNSIEGRVEANKEEISTEVIHTGIPGFDELISNKGIARGISVLISGSPGSGKTLFCLQLLKNAVLLGEKCYYVTFEESPEKLREHMRAFGWPMKKIEANLTIERKDPLILARSVEALLKQATGSLTMDIENITSLIPRELKPSIVVVDSITALASAFVGKQEAYRIYIEQLFRYFEKLGVTVIFITETSDAPRKFSESGVEEFLADGVVVFYNIQKEDTRVRAVEILKLRGQEHVKRIVPFNITSTGLIVFPEEHIYVIEDIMKEPDK